MSKVIVVGGGAAGIIAAISAAYLGHEVTIFEKNEKLGKKIYITGKGRCNVTNASSMNVIMDNVVSNKEFLYSCFSQFDNSDIMRMIEAAGCKLKVERGNRVFPVSDKSSDVLKALTGILNNLNVKILLNTKVDNIIIENNVCIGIIYDNNKKKEYADKIIIATGGLSYAATGSSGDGYKFARTAGHNITRLIPSLVPLYVKENVENLAGLSLRNVNLSINLNGKVLYSEFGEMLFTHEGISGPLVLRASSICGDNINISSEKNPCYAVIDLKPNLSYEVLDKRLVRDFEKSKNKVLKNILVGVMPSSLISKVCKTAEVDEYISVNNITKLKRADICNAIKNLKFTVSGLGNFNQAVITKGGINVKEINPKNMESKLIKNLRFAGEILDIDALTGGYNLQLAWSSGYSAGGDIDYV